MKRTATLLLLLLAGICTQAQSYIPFPDANAIWTERRGKSEAPPEIYTYGLTSQDTVLNGVTYHQLFRSADSVLSPNEFWAGLRQDVAAKKVYLCTPGNPEQLLFDFSLQAGDIFHSNLQVSNIDSVLMGGVYRRRFSFVLAGSGTPVSDQWVEGIGNTDVGGPFGYPSLQPTCDCGNSTLCVSVDGQWIYHSTHYTVVNCYKTTAINEFPQAWPQVLLYPNPLASGKGHIVLYRNHDFTTLDIYNMAGSKVCSYEVTGKTDISFDREAFAAGIYCYRLAGAGGAATGRFVVE